MKPARGFGCYNEKGVSAEERRLKMAIILHKSYFYFL